MGEPGAVQQAWESPPGCVEGAVGDGATARTGIQEYYRGGVYDSPPRRATRISIRRIIDEVYDYKGAYENPRFDPIEEPLGLVWKEDVGKERPFGKASASIEIKNDALAAALQKSVDRLGRETTTISFSRTEWDDFKLKGLSTESFIKVGAKIFKPVPPKGKNRKRREQEGRTGQIILLVSAVILLASGAACVISALTSEYLVDDITARLCTNLTFACLDQNKDGCLEDEEWGGAVICTGDCRDEKVAAFTHIAAASSSDGECSDGSASPQDYIAVVRGLNSSARNRTDMILDNSAILRSDLTRLCRLDLKKQAGCLCFTTEGEDCDCADADIGIIQAVWDTVCLKLWVLGFGVATVLTGIPALISGVKHVPCLNTSCYSACASFFSVIFVIIGAVFLGIASIISSNSARWTRNFGIENCQKDASSASPSFDYGYDIVDTGYGYEAASAATSEDAGGVDLAGCTDDGYCKLLENIGEDLAARLF